jgi:parvulin-like peptidyl-prolyl isomerase
MKLLRITPAILVALVLLAVSACGGGQSVPSDAVAVVDGTEIPRTKLDELIDRAQKTYEAQGQDFPKVGTPEYLNVQSQYVKFLVQVEEFEQEAEELDIEITEKDIDKEEQSFVESRFKGKRADFEKALKEQGFTVKAFRETIRTSVLSQKLFDAVTKDVEVPDAEILAYYQQNQASYGTPESRDVRHILVSEKKGDEVDFEASKAEADRLYAELQDGADFAALAKAESADEGSAVNGGKLTISRGQTVPEFDKLSFELKPGEISKPVKTTFGYHIIEALSPVKKATTTPLNKVRASIRSTLLQEKKTDVMTEWVKDLDDKYADKVSYAAGFEPPELPEETDTETETETDATE